MKLFSILSQCRKLSLAVLSYLYWIQNTEHTAGTVTLLCEVEGSSTTSTNLPDLAQGDQLKLALIIKLNFRPHNNLLII